MASFMANLFPSGKQQQQQQQHERDENRPSTPVRNSFITPISTPQGSPSKKTVPPGANELPVALEQLKLNTSNALESPVKLGRPQNTVAPLSPGRGNGQNLEESSPGSVDESVIHKGTPGGSPLRKQGQENTPPAISRGAAVDASHLMSHAAFSRQDIYSLRTSAPAKKFNTSRGLTAEELEILKKPSVKRLVNVTQLCKSSQIVQRDHRVQAARGKRDRANKGWRKQTS
jgi:cell cycle protein kinase DBF2